jgi:hypothetical protein
MFETVLERLRQPNCVKRLIPYWFTHHRRDDGKHVPHPVYADSSRPVNFATNRTILLRRVGDVIPGLDVVVH